MPFNLDDYVPVQERVDAFWQQHPQGRIITTLIKWEDGECIFRADIFVGDDATMPVSNGWAQERQSATGVNLTSPVENCETSAIGRALANLGMTKSRKGQRASRDELRKARVAEIATNIAGDPNALTVHVQNLATRAGMEPEALTETWRRKRGDNLSHEEAVNTVGSEEWAAFIVTGTDYLDRRPSVPAQ